MSGQGGTTRGSLFIVSAPSGAGKTSLVHALIGATPDLVCSISHTTRPRRGEEQDGVDYFFIDPRRFEEMIEDDRFLEHAVIYGHRYGTTRAAVARELEAGHDVMLEIDWQGARQVRERMPGAVSLFILPPSLEELQVRLERRGQDGPEIIERRMQEAVSELRHHGEYDFLVVNDDFHRALSDLQAIVRAERLRTRRQGERLAGALAGLMAREHGFC